MDSEVLQPAVRPGANRVRSRPFVVLALALWATLLGGCETARYYGQAIHGQARLMARRESIPKLLARTNTPPELAARLRLVLELRAFAERELGLPANGHYLAYADLGRRFAVWNVYAAPEFSLEARSWWYPVVGRLTYRGFFREAEARRFAARLALRGEEVYVGGITAYSTLGWFRDPVLNTFIFDSDTDLAELLFHELTHQRVFVPGDTDYNEALATAVAEEGVRRWLRAQRTAAAVEAYDAEIRRRDAFLQLLTAARDRLETLYQTAAVQDSNPRPAATRTLREAKEQVWTDLRRDYERLKAEQWNGRGDYDGWFRHPMNNARLNTVDTYHRWVPAFRLLLARQGGRLDRFLAEMDRLARLPAREREGYLDELRIAARAMSP